MKNFFKIINAATGIILACASILAVSCDYKIKGYDLDNEVGVADVKIYAGNYTFLGNINGNKITFKVPPSVDLAELDGATASFYVPNLATVSPLPSVPQNYNETVTFTVTSADRSKQENYTVNWIRPDLLPPGSGIGFTYSVWNKKWADLGFSPNNPNGVAVFGDYLVFSRTYEVVNRHTGERMENMTLNKGDYEIFFVTNDDAGNLVGCTYEGQSPGFVKFYTWTDIQAPPVFLGEIATTGGRKFDIRGDINSTAYLAFWNLNNLVAGDEYVYKFAKIENGVLTELPDIVSGIEMNTGPNWPSIALGAATENTTYYTTTLGFYTSTWEGAKLSFGNTSGAATGNQEGPITTGDRGSNRWGNLFVAHNTGFAFNGVEYIGVQFARWAGYSFSILRRDEIASGANASQISDYEVIDPALPWVGSDNRTSSIVAYVSPDGEELDVYILGTNSGVAAYKMTRYEK